MPELNGTAKHPPKWKLEYLTFAPSKLHPPASQRANSGTATETERGGEEEEEEEESVRGKKSKGGGGWSYPIPLKHLPKSLRNATRTKSKYAPYKMEDLTIPSWLRLARRLGRTKNAKLRKRFRRYMYMGADEEL